MNNQSEPNSKIEVSTVIPVYNEQSSVQKTVETIHQTLGRLGGNFEIIAVNDGSADQSGKILDSINLPNLKVLHHKINRGYGASLKTGIKLAQFPWILVTDADGTYPVDKIPDLLNDMQNFDMVVGSRNGKKVHDTLPRKIGRGIVRKFASYVAGYKIPDINSGLRVFKKQDAERFWNLFPDGFSFTTTITVASHTRGNAIKYIPIDYFKRAGKSSIKPAKDFIGFLSLIAKLALYFRPLKVLTPVAATLFVLSWIVLFGSYFFLDQILDATWAVLFISSIQIQIFGFVADMIVKRFYSDK